MVNFMRNDLLIQKNYLLLFVPTIALLIIVGLPASFVLFMTMTYIPLNAVYLDSQSNSSRFLTSLPYTRKEIVIARYINTIAYSVICGSILNVIYFFLGNRMSLQEISFGVTMTLLFTALYYPLHYLLNSQKAMIILFYGSFISFSLIIIIALNIMDNPYMFFNHIQFFVNISFGFSMLFYILSWLVSMKIFANKDL